jgi:hypothetical protein
MAAARQDSGGAPVVGGRHRWFTELLRGAGFLVDLLTGRKKPLRELSPVTVDGEKTGDNGVAYRRGQTGGEGPGQEVGVPFL